MSESKRPTPDLVDAPFIDDEERAEAAWLLARDSDPSTPAPSRELARDHAELEDLLGNLPAGASVESWHDEVLRLATSSAAPSRPPRRRRAYRWAIAGALVAAAAVAAVVLIPRPRPRAGGLEVAIRPGDPARGDSTEAVVGDHVVIRARPRGTGDLRVYRADGVLVARCPDGPGCITAAHGEHAIDVRLDAPVQYHVILVDGLTGDLPGQTMDAYLDAARAANARIVTYPPIDVH
jgi:hypothetical protein